jgi:transposase
MPWKTMDVREQRVKFVVTASRQEQPFRQLCQEFGISRPTGYAWLSRYQRQGIEGIQERAAVRQDRRSRANSYRKRGREWCMRGAAEVCGACLLKPRCTPSA